MEKVARGYRSSVQMDYEPSFGTAPEAPSSVSLPVNSFGVTVSRAKNSAQTLTGRRDPVEPFDGNVETSGSVVVPVDARAFGYWLKLLFGPPQSSGSDGAYTHIFRPEDSSPSAILQCSYGTDPETFGLYRGCKVSSLELSAGGDGELTATVNIAGKSGSFSSESYHASPAAVPLKRFSNFQATLKKDGEAFGVCTAFDFTFDNGLDTETRTIGGSGELYDLPEGIISVTGTATCLFTGLAMLEEAQASKEMALELSFSINENFSLSFLFPEVQLEFKGPSVDGPSGVRTEYSFIAYANDSSENTVCKVTLKNDRETY